VPYREATPPPAPKRLLEPANHNVGILRAASILAMRPAPEGHVSAPQNIEPLADTGFWLGINKDKPAHKPAYR